MLGKHFYLRKFSSLHVFFGVNWQLFSINVFPCAFVFEELLAEATREKFAEVHALHVLL